MPSGGAAAPQMMELRRLAAHQFDNLLAEEADDWARKAHWDFRPSAALLTRYIDRHALDGAALLVRGEAAGYVYYVAEGHKGLVGDLYLRAAWRNPENEGRLLAAALDGLRGSRHIERVEAQLLLLDAVPRLPASVPPPEQFARLLLGAPLQAVSGLARCLPPGQELTFAQWEPALLEEAAALIAAAYRGHIDSQINDQYRSVHGSRRFLQNIIQYPGCGEFRRAASWVAREAESGRLVGLALASEVAAGVGHVTQLCVDPAGRRRGLGYELLRHTLCALARGGCHEVTLTVTAANAPAVELYRRLGFTVLREFPALVWEL
jgi:ribosomal protein S18 acetylase RimI-like enzyme